MDFYTIKTTDDLTIDSTQLAEVVKTIGFFCQPEIVGEPYEEDGKYCLRFAVRKAGLFQRDDDMIALLSRHCSTPELIKATKL